MGIKTENRIKTKRNGEIEFWRAVFCMIVFIYHISLDFDSSTTIFKMGQIGVEFFFLISGLFMAKSPNNDTADFGCTPFYRWGAFSVCGVHFICQTCVYL